MATTIPKKQAGSAKKPAPKAKTVKAAPSAAGSKAKTQKKTAPGAVFFYVSLVGETCQLLLTDVKSAGFMRIW